MSASRFLTQQGSSYREQMPMITACVELLIYTLTIELAFRQPLIRPGAFSLLLSTIVMVAGLQGKDLTSPRIDDSSKMKIAG